MAKSKRSAHKKRSVTTRPLPKQRSYYKQAFKEALLPVAMPIPHPKTFTRRLKFKTKMLINPALFIHPTARKSRILKKVLPGFAYRLWRSEKAIRKECIRRRIRQEVMFAKGGMGKKNKKPPEMRPESRIKC